MAATASGEAGLELARGALSDRPKLLLVDDRPENLLALEGLLRSTEAKILKADSGRRALELLLEHEVALAIIDVQMPELDGFQLAELMRGVERTREIPIIFVTAGFHDQARVFKGYEAGAVDFLVKPLEPRILASKVGVFLLLHRQKRQLAERVSELEDALLERRRAEGALCAANERLRLLSRTAGQLLTAEDPQGAVEGLCREVMAHLDCQVFCSVLYDEETGEPRLNACGGLSDEEVRRGGKLDDGAAIGIGAGDDREPLILEELSRSGDPRAAGLKSLGLQAYCRHPLIAQGRLLGALSFGAKGRASFGRDEVDLMRTVADQVATAMERVRSRRALGAANARLVESDRRKNEFLAVLSHELRNPLAPLKNSLYILDRAPAGGEQARRAHQVIDRQVTQLANLVNDLLDVTRISRNKIQLQKERLNLNELVQRTVDDHRAAFEKSEIRVDLATPRAAVFVIADSTRVAQLVSNLLQNAAKFTHRGGRTSVSVAKEPGSAVVRVADDGVGMTPETVARLFQPFTQADHSLDRSRGGLGLGLALVKGLVDLHGGSVSARSEGLGKGAEFVVRLPLAAGPPDERGAPRARQDLAPRRVLIIEDNVDAAESLREALELRQHQVEVAYNGPEGLEKTRAFRPEVVLCDIGLPGMDGYEVARALRAERAQEGAFLVALSGYALPEDLERAAQAGFQRHIAKPPNLDALEELLASAPALGGALDSRPERGSPEAPG
jgi:signal transduction histidine kinase/DNA-binding response OmpR family regulator